MRCAPSAAALTIGSIFTSLLPASGVGAEDYFICTTVERSTRSFSISDYASRSKVERGNIENILTKFSITDYGSSFLSNRWLRSDGNTPYSDAGVITIGIAFIGGTDEQRNTVRSLAQEWLSGDLKQLIRFQFDMPVRKSQIRISFDPDLGNNSLIGRESLLAPIDKHTMNLSEVSRRAVLHEFGHALGLMHEHKHPEGGIDWEREVVLQEMLVRYGWSKQTTQAQILERFPSEAACVGDRAFNRDSIMMYPIPEHWTKNKFSVKLNTDIHERDYKCLIGLYNL
ncbi:hypothetical protein GOA61_18130 [Sinorhizobium meliloti]|nr:hypothetical protein [Sinorhizobium meliloti]MDW9877661.1 hypothetical protein [Sinorhizobium meliloti]